MAKKNWYQDVKLQNQGFPSYMGEVGFENTKKQRSSLAKIYQCLQLAYLINFQILKENQPSCCQGFSCQMCDLRD